jgi:hypothetical protein
MRAVFWASWLARRARDVIAVLLPAAAETVEAAKAYRRAARWHAEALRRAE